MTRRRWIADEVSRGRAALTGPHADHLTRVLRASVGQEFDVVAEGVVRRGRVTSVAEGRIDFALGEEIESAATVGLTLFLSIFKFDRMEWAIEKCTELGVQKIVPLIARRTDSYLALAAVKRAERWRRIAIQASEQSRRAATPEITAAMKIREAVDHAADLRIVLSESETETALAETLRSRPVCEAALAVGPEGGWTEEELQLFSKRGWVSASLGPTILRTETAAIAASAIAISALSR
jgi:16S rRNA (uracil1498-N3)-methyltransferase